MGYVNFHMFSVRICNGLLHTINLLAKNLTVAEEGRSGCTDPSTLRQWH